MSKMKSELERRLDENKYELLSRVRTLLGSLYQNALDWNDIDYVREIVDLIENGGE